MLHIIQTSNLIGQSIIAYLQQKGFPEVNRIYYLVRDYLTSFPELQIALHFVQDNNTRFDLAIECGNLEVAMETAKIADRLECWERLAQQALKQGNHAVCALCVMQHVSVLKHSLLDSRESLPTNKKISPTLLPLPCHRQLRQT
jgi:coatomer subunit alpha